MLNRNWAAVYTTPQTTKNQLGFLNSTGSYQLNDHVTIKGNVYYRGFRQKHVDGNTSEVEPCDPALFPGFLCFGEDDNLLFSPAGPVPDFLNGATPGSLDRTRTRADSYGGSVQAANSAPLMGHNNSLVIGTSLDHGRVRFNASSELGIINPDLVVAGTGIIIVQPDGTVAPVDLRTRNTYFGWYITDTFDVTSRLSLTAGGRFNLAQIALDDQIGTALNGSHRFIRFNPVLGATYKVTPQLNVYAGYAEANRAPTPLELACADPARPCLIDNFLVADPPLKQVVASTWEAGLRGSIDLGARNGRISWKLGGFHTTSEDDILQVASEITGRGFFQNVGATLRRGIEASADYRSARWSAYASYNYIDATFLDTFTVNSPGNPLAVDGVVTVTPGNVIPSIPAHRFKAGAEYNVLDNWKVGADLVAVSGQYLRGDENNLNPMLPGYWVANLNTRYKITKELEAFGLVRNLFNRRYYTFGTFFETDEIPFLGLTDPRTFSPGAPLTAYAGLRGRF
jgi:iron complex outermembrane receptor protein